MAHAARLFANHASAPPSTGPWWLAEQGSDPSLLTDAMQDLLSAAADPHPFPAEPGRQAPSETPKGGQWLENHDLEQLYGHCDIPAHQWSLVTNLLEKLAIVTAALPMTPDGCFSSATRHQPSDRRCEADLPPGGTAPQGGLGRLCAAAATGLPGGLVQQRRPRTRSGNLQSESTKRRQRPGGAAGNMARQRAQLPAGHPQGDLQPERLLQLRLVR